MSQPNEARRVASRTGDASIFSVFWAYEDRKAITR